MAEQMLRIEELALVIGVSTQTINNWYRWKRAYPDNEYAKLLPDYEQKNTRGMRLWKRSDVWAVINFKNSIPHGRNGVLGDITQRRYEYKKGKTNEQNESI